MRKIIYILLLLFCFLGCADNQKSFNGKAEETEANRRERLMKTSARRNLRIGCIDGVQYVYSLRGGITVAYNRNGTIKKCD